jgi:hypothetical protein
LLLWEDIGGGGGHGTACALTLAGNLFLKHVQGRKEYIRGEVASTLSIPRLSGDRRDDCPVNPHSGERLAEERFCSAGSAA